MMRLAMRPAKSFSNQPTDWRSTCLCARQRIRVPKFGKIVLFSNSTSTTCSIGRNNKTNTAIRINSAPWSCQTSAGEPDNRSTTRPM